MEVKIATSLERSSRTVAHEQAGRGHNETDPWERLV